MATLTVTRLHDSLGALRSVTIEVDGEKRLKVRRGRTVSLEIDDGPHTVRARMDWYTSEVVEVQGESHLEVDAPFRSITKLVSGYENALVLQPRRADS